MKRALLLLTLLLVSCNPDTIDTVEPVAEPFKQGLTIDMTVADNTNFNIGVETAGAYILKISNLNGELLSKSKLNLDDGNNRLSFYTKSLGSQPIEVTLTGPDGQVVANSKIGTK